MILSSIYCDVFYILTEESIFRKVALFFSLAVLDGIGLTQRIKRKHFCTFIWLPFEQAIPLVNAKMIRIIFLRCPIITVFVVKFYLISSLTCSLGCYKL